MLTKESVLSTVCTQTQAALYYLGQVGFLIRYRDTSILIDGYLTDYVDRHFATEAVPWKRRYDPPIDPRELDFIDAVLCTHDHADHTDPDTIRAILSVNDNVKFYGTPCVAACLRNIGVPAERITALGNDAAVTFGDDITVRNVPSAHEELHPDENGDCREGGFHITLGTGTDAISIYHAGDCCLWDGLEERITGTDIMILPVNGRDYYRRYEQNIIGNFDSREAVLLAKRCHAKLLIPVHMDLYDVNALDPAVFVSTLQTYHPQQCYHIPRPGERIIYCN